MKQAIKDKIIENGVKNLADFGYTDVTKENIMKDQVYKMFFETMLKDNLGQGFDEEIYSILVDLEGL